MKRNTVRNIKLGGILTGLVTASIGITAFSLPQFNSMDSYLYTPTNWTQSFVNREEAIKYLEYLYNEEEFNLLFNEEVAGTRTVNTYSVESALEGIKNDYFNAYSTSSGEIKDDDDLSIEDQYANLKEDFIKSIANHLVTSITSKATNVYVPTSELNNGNVFASSEWVNNLSQYYRGFGDEAFQNSTQAFSSLLDQSQIVFEYNGSNYDTVDEVILAWMNVEGFDLDTAYSEIINHIRWDASGSYTDTNQIVHSFQAYDDNANQDDLDTFKLYAEREFYNQMVTYETYDAKVYEESEWLVTSDYEDSRDAWLSSPANQVVFDAPLNQNLQSQSMGDALGWAGEANTPASEFIPMTNTWNQVFWQYENQSVPTRQIPNLHNNIQYNSDFALISLVAWYTKALEDHGTNNIGLWTRTSAKSYCDSNGNSDRTSEAWQDWTAYAQYMGFDKIEIPVEDRPNTDANTINKWWEPDCEGLYSSRNLSSTNDAIELSGWFADTFLIYFGYEMVSSNHDWKYNYWMDENKVNLPIQLSFDNTFTFTDKSNNGAITGKTMLDALMNGGSLNPTEQDYLNSSTAKTADFLDWVSQQDVIYYWNNGVYRGQTEAQAKALVDAAIRTKIELEWVNINYSQATTTSFDIEASHQDVLRALDPSFNMTGYQSIDDAKHMIKQLIGTEGANNIYTEVGLVKFLDDSYYNFDTDIEFLTIEEARDYVNWELTYSSVWSEAGVIAPYSSLVEYHTSAIQMLEAYNDSTVDIAFTTNITTFASMLANGYDFSSIDSSIDNLEVVITDIDYDNPSATEETTQYRISILFDNYDTDLTKWVESEFFELDTEDHLAKMDEARLALINSWIDQLTY